MPDIDGITALPLLLEKKRDLVVLMASTLTRRNAEISLRALSLGAADYIPKPETTRDLTTSSSFRRELIDKIRALGTRRKRGLTRPRDYRAGSLDRPRSRSRSRERRTSSRIQSPSTRPPLRLAPPDPEKVLLRPFPMMTPRVLLIGSSTGGPQALNAILAAIGAVIDQAPVLDHAAHAADLHDHSRRASDAHQRTPGTRSDGRRDGSRRPHLCGAAAAGTCGSCGATATR